MTQSLITKTQNLDTQWLFALAENAYSEDFFKDWIFQLPKDWTLLPDGRVITGENVVWFPSGIVEELLSIDQRTDFYQRRVDSFVQFFREEIDENYQPIPNNFILNYDDMSIRSPSEWIYY